MNFKIVLLTMLLIPTLNLCMEQDLRKCTYLANTLDFPVTIKTRNEENSYCVNIKSKYEVDKNQFPGWESSKYFTVIPEKSHVIIPFNPVYCSLVDQQKVWKYFLGPDQVRKFLPRFDIYKKMNGDLEAKQLPSYGFSEPPYFEQVVELYPIK